MELRALVIEPDNISRHFLWQAMLLESYFHNARAMQSLEQALDHLKTGNTYEAILVSSAFEHDRLSMFIRDARSAKGGMEAAYIMIMHAQEQSRENVAVNILDGSDGFLFLPFSVQAVRDVADIAKRIHAEHEEKRKMAAMELIIKEVHNAFVIFIAAKHGDGDAALLYHRFKRTAKLLKKIGPEDLPLYKKLMIPHLEKADPVVPSMYDGASQRIREKMRQRAKQLEEGR
jgi:hypothetical protein